MRLERGKGEIVVVCHACVREGGSRKSESGDRASEQGREGERERAGEEREREAGDGTARGRKRRLTLSPQRK